MEPTRNKVKTSETPRPPIHPKSDQKARLTMMNERGSI